MDKGKMSSIKDQIITLVKQRHHSHKVALDQEKDPRSKHAIDLIARIREDSKLIELIDSLSDNDFLDESIIASKDLDLDKEYNDFVESDPVYSKLVNNIVGKAIARHFAEWGRMRFRDTEKSQNEMSENIGQLKKIAAQAYVAQLVLSGKAPDGLTISPLREIAENAFIYGAEWGAKHLK